MENTLMRGGIKVLVNAELKNARKHFENMHSAHEGYAVILEELDEALEQAKYLKDDQEYLWLYIKENNTELQEHFITEMTTNTENLIVEAIQLKAMIQRFKEDVLKG